MASPDEIITLRLQASPAWGRLRAGDDWHFRLSLTRCIYLFKQEVVHVTRAEYWVIRPLLLEYYEAEIKRIFIFFRERSFWNAAARQNTNFHMPRNSKAAPYFLNTNKFKAKYCMRRWIKLRDKSIWRLFFHFCVSCWPIRMDPALDVLLSVTEVFPVTTVPFHRFQNKQRTGFIGLKYRSSGQIARSGGLSSSNSRLLSEEKPFSV